MLSSNDDNDRLAGARGLIRLLEGNGCTIHDLMALVEHGKIEDGGAYSEAELLQIYQSGFVDGQKSVQHQQVEYRIDWPQIANAIAPYIEDLNDKEREFVTDVTRRIRIGREPTEKQANWLKDIYLKLGRRYGFNTI